MQDDIAHVVLWLTGADDVACVVLALDEHARKEASVVKPLRFGIVESGRP